MNQTQLTGPPMRLRLGNQVLPMVGRVRMYVCGITPYDVTHLGHAATYIWADAAERVLRWHGHNVTVARNVTDVDDVLFAEARRRGEAHTMLATLQRAAFEGTMSTLQVRPPDHSPSAAGHIGHVVQLASALLDNGACRVRTQRHRLRPHQRGLPTHRARSRDRTRAGRRVPRRSGRRREGRPAGHRGLAGVRPR